MTATNHVSALTEDFNVTVDRLQPMANLSVRGVPDVVPQGSSQTLTTSVLLDMAVAATVRYEQGLAQTCGGGAWQLQLPIMLCVSSCCLQAATAVGVTVEGLASFSALNNSEVPSLRCDRWKRRAGVVLGGEVWQGGWKRPDENFICNAWGGLVIVTAPH